jgi:hypothetical protein
MLPTKIGKQVRMLQKRLDAVGCCHDAELFESPSGKILGIFSVLINGCEFKEGGVELWFESSYMMLPSTVMIRASVVPAHGFDERLRYLNDWLFDVEIFKKGKCVVINEALVRYRRHTANVSGDAQARQIANEEKMIALGIVDARYPELHHLVKRRKQAFFYADAILSFKNSDIKKARHCLTAAAQQGAWFRSMVLLVALLFFGSYISKQMGLLRYQRSSVFIFLSKYF